MRHAQVPDPEIVAEDKNDIGTVLGLQREPTESQKPEK
jgi:hypothetical protein